MQAGEVFRIPGVIRSALRRGRRHTFWPSTPLYPKTPESVHIRRSCRTEGPVRRCRFRPHVLSPARSVMRLTAVQCCEVEVFRRNQTGSATPRTRGPMTRRSTRRSPACNQTASSACGSDASACGRRSRRRRATPTTTSVIGRSVPSLCTPGAKAVVRSRRCSRSSDATACSVPTHNREPAAFRGIRRLRCRTLRCTRGSPDPSHLPVRRLILPCMCPTPHAYWEETQSAVERIGAQNV